MATATRSAAKQAAPRPSTAKPKPKSRATVTASTAAPAAKAGGKGKGKPNGAAEADAAKPKKVKPVRDSFTMPKNEYAVLEDLKLRAARLGRPTKKSEVLRAGVQALAAMGDAAFLAAVGAVPAIKTGRPAGT